MQTDTSNHREFNNRPEEINNEDEDGDPAHEEQDLYHVLLDSSNASFRGMRVMESIDPSQSDSFLKVRRENNTTAVSIFINKPLAGC